MPSPPKPIIKYGKFPFRLIYEINGKRKVIEDAIICTYDGITTNEGNGKHRKWRAKYASGKDTIYLDNIGENKYIYFTVNYPEYFMGDPCPDVQYDNNPGCIMLYDATEYPAYNALTDEILFRDYHIKIIKYECAKPIKNTFK